MKINTFYVNEKKYLIKWIYIVFGLLCIGITVGAVYCSMLKTASSLSVSNYLKNFFSSYNIEVDKFASFKSSVFESIKFFTIIFLCSYIKPGIIIICGCAALKGFVSGFTIASFIKFYKVKGLLVYMCRLPSTLFFIPAFVFFCAYSIIFCINRQKSEKNKVKKYILLSFCCLTIFCITSFYDGYISTIFMKLAIPLITK
ncbi:MAG: stage II sporulation protein M [Clostridia bacterium]|nr:stage II sporulation protein M [Clostridia bacterium]